VMRRLSMCVLCLALALSLALPAWAAPPQETNSFLIRINGAIPANLASQVSAAGGTLVRVLPEIGYATAVSNDEGFAAKLKKNSVIQDVDRDLEAQWIPAPEGLRTAQAPQASIQAVGDPENSFFYSCLWHLPKINAPAAWAQGVLGDPGVKVAVLDTGVDPFHQDLAGKIDGASASMLTPGSSPCGAFDEETIYDLHYHGSFVSGLITTNNLASTGIAPLTRIVGVKVLNCNGRGSFGEIIAGILYASNLPDVAVINMSLSIGFNKNLPGAGPLVAAMNKAVNYAESQGKLVVSAAGNAGTDMDHDGNFIRVPAQSGSGIAAYASTNLDGLASYSNHGVSGTWVGAPGGDFPNTAAPLPGCLLGDDLEGLIASVCSSFVCGGNNFYTVDNGTSFAAPLVAGVAALVDGKHGGALNAGQLKTILKDTADDLGAPGTDNLFSHGRVNAGNAADQ